MYRALQISEVCWEICAAIKQGQSKGWRRNLAAFAITARVVSEPALAVLWEEVDWFGSLLLLLPCVRGVDWCGVRWDGSAGELRMTRPLRPEDWQRFDVYAKRVRTLQYSGEWGINPLVFNDILSSRPGTLLPSLRVLVWRASRGPDNFDSSSYDIQHGLHPFLHPGLKRLQLSSSDPLPFSFGDIYVKHRDKDMALETILERVSEMVPTLEVLECYARPLRLASMEFMNNFTRLRSFVFTACPLHSNAMRHLSSMSNLTRISVNALASSARHVSHLSGFHALEILHVMHGNIEFGEALLGCIRSSRLHEFLWESEIGGKVPGEAFFERLARFPLSVLHIDLSMPGRDQTSTIFDFHNVRTLFSTSSLTGLRLRDTSLSNDDLQALASAWPRLQSLVIFGQETKTLSFSSIVFLARSCPDLSSIKLQSYFVASIPKGEDIPILSNKLEHLCIDDFSLSIHRDWSPLAWACLRIFPNLRSFNSRPIQEAIFPPQTMVSRPARGRV